MKDISHKINLIFLPYLLISISIICGYTLFRYWLDYRFEILHIKDEILDFILPAIITSFLILIFLRRSIHLLVMNNDKGFSFLQLIALVSIVIPIVIAQKYLEKSNRRLIHIESIQTMKIPKKEIIWGKFSKLTQIDIH